MRVPYDENKIALTQLLTLWVMPRKTLVGSLTSPVHVFPNKLTVWAEVRSTPTIPSNNPNNTLDAIAKSPPQPCFSLISGYKVGLLIAGYGAYAEGVNASLSSARLAIIILQRSWNSCCATVRTLFSLFCSTGGLNSWGQLDLLTSAHVRLR